MTDLDSGITFLRSTTTTRVNREADGDTKITVEHTARFAVSPGTLPDMAHKYGKQIFRPQFAVVDWRNGKLDSIAITGQRVLKGGRLSDSGHDTSRNYDWAAYDLRDGAHRTASWVPVPEPLRDAIAAYETAVVSAR